MKIIILMMASVLSACATVPHGSRVSSYSEIMLKVDAVPSAQPSSVSSAYHPHDAVTLIDSRAVRAMHGSDLDMPMLGLTDGQRLAVIIGATIVGIYVVSDWIEDETPLVVD